MHFCFVDYSDIPFEFQVTTVYIDLDCILDNAKIQADSYGPICIDMEQHNSVPVQNRPSRMMYPSVLRIPTV
jgi:hypothetical protein